MAIVFRDSDGTARLYGDLLAPGGATGDVLTQQADGTYAPAAGGSQPVTCVLEAYPVDVKDGGPHPLKWTALFNNPADFDALAAIPDGLGLTFAFDGSSETITTTEPGVWAFTLGFGGSGGDATWAGKVTLDAGLYIELPDFVPSAVTANSAPLAEILSVPAGYSIAPSVFTSTAGTGVTVDTDTYLVIVRLA